MDHLKTVDPVENRLRMGKGELYYAFTPDLLADRRRATAALRRYNDARDPSRRQQVELWKECEGEPPVAILDPDSRGHSVVDDKTPLPRRLATGQEDDDLFVGYPWVDQPVTKVDYGYNIKLGDDVYVNSGSTWIDTCTVEIGARTLVGPNCSFLSGTHPLDPSVRQGTRGPEAGKPIRIGEDCWLGGGVTVLPGVTIGRGVTVGAGSVVTKDVPDLVVVAGNPARMLKKVDAVGAVDAVDVADAADASG